jgi:polyhydroxybutyrate depolymerase
MDACMSHHFTCHFRLTVLVVGLILSTSLHAESPTRRDELRSKLRQRLQDRGTSQSETHELEHAGQTRSFRLFVPKSVSKDKAVPLVIALHGFGADAVSQEVMSGLDEVAKEQQFIVAYPDGIGRMWRFWETLGPSEDRKPAVGSIDIDDVGFIAALMDQLIEAGAVDRRRVYVTGMSNGAFMTNRLGYELGDKIAAIAPVAGTLPKNMAEQAKPSRPMPVIYFHGNDDKIVKKDGVDMFSRVGFSLSSMELAQWWAKRNGCRVEAQVDVLPDSADDGTTSRDLRASEVMWEFFKQHALIAR